MKAVLLALCLCMSGCVGYTVYTGCMTSRNFRTMSAPIDGNCYVAAELTLAEGQIYTPKKEQVSNGKAQATKGQLPNSGEQAGSCHK